MKKTFIFLFLAIVLTFIYKEGFFTEKDVVLSKSATALSVQDPVTEIFIPQDVTIVAAGDSLTQGVGDSTEQGGYIPYLQARLENEKEINKTMIYNFGVNGNTSNQLLKRLQTEEVEETLGKADIVILTIGGNDMMKVVRENLTGLEKADFFMQKEIFAENLRSTFNYIRQKNEKSLIVLVGLYNPFNKWFPEIQEMNEVVNDWNEASQAILSQYHHTYFVDIMDVFEGEAENILYTDYFHPNDKGYELIAEEVYGELADGVVEQLVEQKSIVQKR